MNKQNTEVKADANLPLDILKWVGVIALLGAAFAGNYYYRAEALSLRLIGWLVAGLMTAALASTTLIGRRFVGFANDAKNELRKVVWPTRQEAIQTTIVVLALVVLVGLILWGVDSFLFWTIGYLTGQRG
jgi:preprotein translocase subunit SecE